MKLIEHSHEWNGTFTIRVHVTVMYSCSDVWDVQYVS